MPSPRSEPSDLHRAGDPVAPTEPFVEATVVRAEAPTSARAGDTAVVRADGTIEGFVGGQCVETSVAAAAVDALRSGEAILLRILPEGAGDFPDVDGARTVVNPCLSGGSMEIFLVPRTPRPVVGVIGRTPIARALEQLLPFVGIRAETDGPDLPACVGVVVATHGHEEVEGIRAALAAGVPYIGLVASRRRGTELLEEMGLSTEDRGRIRTPVGLDIGARTPNEIALSIAGQLVEAIRRDGIRAAGAQSAVAPEPITTIDPVCGMTVTVTDDPPHLTVDGQEHWFCCTGCRDTFAERARVDA